MSMIICKYSNGIPFQPIEDRKVIDPSYKTKSRVKTFSHSGHCPLTNLQKDLLILIFQKLELKELACISVSCKKFNSLVPDSKIWLPIAKKIGCLLTKDKPAYVQVVRFIQRFVQKCMKWKADPRRTFRNLGPQIDTKIKKFLSSKKLTFELLKMVNLYQEALNTAAISEFLIKSLNSNNLVIRNTSVGNYARTIFVGQRDVIALADSLKKSLLLEHKEHLQKLKVVDLSGYRIPESLLSEIFKIANLTDVTLTKCELTSFPENLLLSKNLKALNLANNSIEEIPAAITGLGTLESLQINGNKIQTLPYIFGYLPNLVSLDINNNQLSTLPSTMGNLRNLKIFTAENNQFQSLPNELLQLAPQLRKLSISKNPMKISANEMKILHSAKQVEARDLPRQFSIYFRYQLIEDIKLAATFCILALKISLELAFMTIKGIFYIIEQSLQAIFSIPKILIGVLIKTIVVVAKILVITVSLIKILVGIFLILSLLSRNASKN